MTNYSNTIKQQASIAKAINLRGGLLLLGQALTGLLLDGRRLREGKELI